MTSPPSWGRREDERHYPTLRRGAVTDLTTEELGSARVPSRRAAVHASQTERNAKRSSSSTPRSTIGGRSTPPDPTRTSRGSARACARRPDPPRPCPGSRSSAGGRARRRPPSPARARRRGRRKHGCDHRGDGAPHRREHVELRFARPRFRLGHDAAREGVLRPVPFQPSASRQPALILLVRLEPLAEHVPGDPRRDDVPHPVDEQRTGREALDVDPLPFEDGTTTSRRTRPRRPRPGRPRAARSPPGTASSSRSRARSRGRTRRSPGRRRARRRCPRCSDGFAARPSSLAIRISRPTPSTSIVTNGFAGTSLRSSYMPTNLPMSSRENPNAVCVRSLVPNEKNSAVSAISAGGDRRARQLDHRAPLEVGELACHPSDSVGHRLELLPHLPQLGRRRDERDHDLDLRVAAVAADLRRRPRRSRAPASRRGPASRCPDARRGGRASGSSRAARSPSAARAFLLVDILTTRLRRARPRPRGRPGSGRNSCSGGSSSRTVTGSPSIAGRCPRSPRAAAAAGRRRPSPPPPRVSAKIILRTASTRSSPRNMCSVRHRPMPSAPRSRAFVDCSGVSAFARTRSRRTRSACAISALERLPDLLLAGRRVTGARLLEHRLLERAARRRTRCPSKPSIVMTSPSCTVVPFAENVRAAERELDRVGAAHRGDALAASDDRRVRVRPAGAREDALRRDHAVVVVGRRLATDEDHRARPARPSALRLVGGEDHLADRGARRGVQPLRDRRAASLGLDAPLEQLLEPVRVHAQQRGVLVDQPLRQHVVRHHPLGERGPLADAGLQDPELRPSRS